MDVLKEIAQEIAIDELRNSPAGEKISQAMETVTAVQRNLCALAESEDSTQLNLLKIGTVFQIFLVDKLASGADPKKMKQKEWGSIASKVSQYAVLEEGQSYSDFVFSLYADYIDLSAKGLSKFISEETLASIMSISSDIRSKTELLREEAISESTYVDDCLWLSLEAMVKLLSSSLTMLIGAEYSQLIQAVSQLAFEYGRYVLYAKEQAILTAYIENQYVLDEQLRQQYDAFRAELSEQAERFNQLIEQAFSSNIRESLMQSAELARAAGVREEEILTSVEDIDAFFMA